MTILRNALVSGFLVAAPMFLAWHTPAVPQTLTAQQQLTRDIYQELIGGVSAFDGMTREQLLAQAAEDAAALGLDVTPLLAKQASMKH